MVNITNTPPNNKPEIPKTWFTINDLFLGKPKPWRSQLGINIKTHPDIKPLAEKVEVIEENTKYMVLAYDNMFKSKVMQLAWLLDRSWQAKSKRPYLTFKELEKVMLVEYKINAGHSITEFEISKVKQVAGQCYATLKEKHFTFGHQQIDSSNLAPVCRLWLRNYGLLDFPK